MNDEWPREYFVGNVYELDGLQVIATNMFLTSRGLESGASKIVATASDEYEAKSLLILLEHGANYVRGERILKL